jgi:hypothetical protein
MLIVCDGTISDAAKTIEKLVEASALPISVVIVGVGAVRNNNNKNNHVRVFSM